MRDAEAYAANLSCWSGPVSLTRIDGGISNDNFRVDDGGRRFVARINGDVPEHGVTRFNDYVCNRAAAAVGIAPHVHHHDTCALVVDYIESRTLRECDVRDDAILARILELIRRTHQQAFRQLRGPVNAFWPFRICRDYAFYLEENNSRMGAELAVMRRCNEELETAVGPIDLVLGHNDLLAANFLDDGDRLWLVDWEHAGLSSPLFDLANLASNNELSETQQKWLLEAYFEAPLRDALWDRFHAMTCASALREAMWAMASEHLSPLNIDYVAYGDDYYQRFTTAFAAWKQNR